MTLTPRRAAFLAIAATTMVTACGSSDEETGAELIATTTVWADITSQVACGEPVDSLIPAGADPHSFEPSLRDRERLDAAALVVANGADLEESVLDILTTVARGGTEVVELASGVDLIEDAFEHGADEADHGHANPHIWLDPVRVADALDVIATSLVDAGRAPAPIAECTADYRAELLALDTEIAELVDVLPADARVLVTNHDELAYFADRYGFEVVGTVLPSTSTIAETDAATLDALSDTIRERDVPAIFVESTEASTDAEALGDRLGVAVVPLTSASLTDDGPASTYLGMMRAAAETITGALAP